MKFISLFLVLFTIVGFGVACDRKVDDIQREEAPIRDRLDEAGEEVKDFRDDVGDEIEDTLD